MIAALLAASLHAAALAPAAVKREERGFNARRNLALDRIGVQNDRHDVKPGLFQRGDSRLA